MYPINVKKGVSIGPCYFVVTHIALKSTPKTIKSEVSVFFMIYKVKHISMNKIPMDGIRVQLTPSP